MASVKARDLQNQWLVLFLQLETQVLDEASGQT